MDAIIVSLVLIAKVFGRTIGLVSNRISDLVRNSPNFWLGAKEILHGLRSDHLFQGNTSVNSEVVSFVHDHEVWYFRGSRTGLRQKMGGS